MKAWRTRLFGVDCLVFAETRSAARYATIRSARRAGYSVPFTEPVTVRRAPPFDGAIGEPGTCYAVQHVGLGTVTL